MFSGIITHIGTIESAEKKGDLRLNITCDFAHELQIGESVACNGVCLTVVECGSHFAVDVSSETVSRTVPGQWGKDRKVNLERSLKLGDRLDGHMVSGHVDGVAIIRNSNLSGDSRLLEIEAPPELARFIAEKGAVTLNGVSLTVNKVKNSRFWVNIIPHTWQNTTLRERKAGDALNLEIDLIARYVARFLEK